MALLERHQVELASAALRAAETAGGDLDIRVPAMIDAWFAYVEEHPYSWLLFRDTTNDPEVRALHRRLQARQRANDVALLRAYAPAIPEPQLEPLGEAVRSSLHGLALFWFDHPQLDRQVLTATMVRLVRGILLTATSAARSTHLAAQHGDGGVGTTTSP